MIQAVRVGRSRAKSQEPAKPVNGEKLLQVLSAVGADVQLIQVPVSRPPWTATTIEVSAGDQITWLAWGYVDLIKPLGARVGPSTGFLCRVGDGKPQESGRNIGTFTADRSGPVEVAGRFPSWVARRRFDHGGPRAAPAARIAP
jgi:hypothetical protein